MGHRAREARQKRGPKRDGQGCNCRVVDPSFDGPSSSSNSGKSVPSAQPMAGSRPFAPQGRHVCTSSARMSATPGDDPKELSPRREVAFDDRLAGPRLPAIRSARRGWCRARSRGRRGGARSCLEGARSQAGQVTRQAFRQCFGTAPEAPSRACRSAHARHICGDLPRQINSADRPGASTNVIAMSVIGFAAGVFR